MPSSILDTLVKRARQAFLALREKAPVTIDESVLEHMLLYHGLIGSGPENQREFRDVRADIIAAINRQSPITLAIALKLPPLWWEDKLKSIFAELYGETKAVAVRLITQLLTASADQYQDQGISSISKGDWRIRANAAILLAFLGIDKADTVLSELLNDTSDSGKLAFPFVSRSLGKLQTEAGKQALAKHIFHSEPWFRVDTAAALALYPLGSVSEPLVKILRAERELKDYMAVAIARNHLPSEFFKSNDQQLLDGGCELIIGIVQGATGTFKEEIVFDTQILQCLEPLYKLAVAVPRPLHVAAALNLFDWLLQRVSEKTPPADLPSATTLKSQIDSVTESYLKTDVVEDLRQALADKNAKQPDQLSDLRYALLLAGRLRLTNTEPLLKTALVPEFPLLPEVIDALGQIGQISSTKALLELAKTTTDLDQRLSLPKSKQPVLEEYPEQAKIYWRILRALGNLDSAECTDFLLKATGDYAPDKRAQALSSLVNVLVKNDKLKFRCKIENVLTEGLRDPSPLVRLAALKGAAALGAGKVVAEIVRLIDARENTVSKEAFDALSELSSKGYSKDVAQLIRPRLKGEREQHKKRQIEALLSAARK